MKIKFTLMMLAANSLILSAQNLQEKTLFHASIGSSNNDVGPAYLKSTSNGTPTSTTDSRGNSGQAIQLDGVDDYLSYPVNSIYQKVLPISFSVWVNLDQVSGNFPVFATDNSTAAYAGIVVQIANGIVYISYGDGQGFGSDSRSSIQSSSVLTAGKWYHIAGVVRGFQNMDLYIDGIKESGATYSGAGSPMSMAYDGAALGIGMYAGKNGNPNQYFKGKIDDLHIWNRELSALEVNLKKNLLLSYSVIAGGTLEDDGPFGLELENIGFLYGKDRFNRDGQTMQMNGSSSFGRIPSSAAYRIQFPQTISAWVKINSHKVFQPIYASSDHVNSKYSGIILYLENGKPALTVGDNQGAGIQFRRSFVAGDSLKVGQWYHLVAVCSALGSTTMYVNGVAVTNGANSGTGNSMVHGTGYGFAGYLSEPNGGAARYFDGSIDELMVLSGEMTPTQISGLFKPAVYFTQEPSDTAVNNLASVLLKSKATGTLPVSFQWYHRINGSWVSLNTNKSSDLSIPSITIADTGLYRCIATITGHADTTRSARISLIPANHSGTQFINRYQLVPNPVQNEISIMNLSQPGFIKIIDGKGQVCFTGMIKAGEKISTAHFANGVYHLQVNNGSGTWSTLFVKI